MVRYQPEGVCAREIQFEVVDGKLRNVRFIGGCPGNLSAIGKLVEGMPVEEAIAKFKGNLCRNGTSCVDQLAKALEALRP
ncbi:MAG TPA: TIGR03905 family TSCPD domain-containing protein [Selenomonadales bacterium]|nr:TIGR03905 family TSCPD domain-containing protein [Selenomonadales bacterium]